MFFFIQLNFPFIKESWKKVLCFPQQQKIILIELFLKDHLAQVMAAEMLKYNIF